MTDQHFPLTDFEHVNCDTMQQRAAAHLALMQRRHTIRKFSDQPVPQQVIEQVIQIAASAPSGPARALGHSLFRSTCLPCSLGNRTLFSACRSRCSCLMSLPVIWKWS